jgi:zinc/manganese transport system substrate-binding protein
MTKVASATRAAVFAGAVLLTMAPTAHAALNVFACMPEWGSLAREIGGPATKVFVAVSPLENPETVTLRPSIIGELRDANLVVCTGGGLENSWLDPALARAQNPKIQAGTPGYFMASTFVKLIKDDDAPPPAAAPGAPEHAHDEGNPHFQGDPIRIRGVALQLAKRMSDLDPAGAAGYTDRAKAFTSNLSKVAAELKQKAAALKGVSVIIQHDDVAYTVEWLGMDAAEAIEPEPGVAPGPARLAEVLKTARAGNVKIVAYAAYLDPKPSRYIATEAKLPLVKLPFTIGGTPEAKDFPSFYRDTVQRLLDGLAGHDRP